MLVQNNDNSYAISEILSDNDMLAILMATIEAPKNIGQLCINCKIPTSTTYRKVQKLAGYGVLHKIGKINDSGKRENWYKSNTYFTKIFLANPIVKLK
jgi:predicted transcriptional regulator